MTAGPFIMTNLEGLFSPFRDLESEMDELRTMRRVSRLWHEMERREHGAWMMFGRFFDRQMDEMDRMTSSSWHSPLFSSDRPDRSFGGRDNPIDKPDCNVIVEFPDDKEIKITLEEPSVIITEVEDSPETTPSSSHLSSGSTRNPGPMEDETSSVPDPEMKTYRTTPVISTSEERTIGTVNPFGKSEKLEKRLKKVDFSKMEVHFEPGSGKVNIVETDEKPPSNQLFRRKKRNRDRSARSESPKLNFVGSVDNESYENISPDLVGKERLAANNILSSNKSNLNLSIFNLRNTLFKNAVDDYSVQKSKNSFPAAFENEFNRSKSSNTARGREKVLSDKNVSSNYSSFTKSSFNLSSKLRDMIQNSAKNQMNFTKAESSCEINQSGPGKWEKQLDSDIQENYELDTCVKYPAGKIICEEANTKANRAKNNISLDQLIYPEKQSINDNKKVNKTKSINRVDSFKKNCRVTRQESLRSTSSRGSISGESKLAQKRNSLKESFRKDSISCRVNRTPSIGKITTNSLKKGGIYVDGQPKRTKGATITLISYSNGSSNAKQNETTNNSYNNITVNNLKKKTSRRDSLKSTCSRESLASLTNKIAQKKKDNSQDNVSKNNNLSAAAAAALTNIGLSKKNSNASDPLNFKIKTGINSVNPRSPIFNNTFYKQTTLKKDVGNNRFESLSKNKENTFTERKLSKENINSSKDRTHVKKFHHENSSLFQPIKKEKSIHSSKINLTEIKTPVPIRKKSNSVESDSNSSRRDFGFTNDVSTRSPIEKNLAPGRSDNLQILNGSSSKLSLSALRRSKEPLRSFEKISNGWVGRCNVVTANRNTKSESQWAAKSLSEMRLASLINNNNSGHAKISSRNSVSLSPTNIPVAPRMTRHQQIESMCRLSRGYPSRKLDSPTPFSITKSCMETRKRSRNVNTPSSVSSQSSNIPVSSKRRSALVSKTESPRVRSRSDTPTPSEPIYETLNSRRKASVTTAIARRNRLTDPCCNI